MKYYQLFSLFFFFTFHFACSQNFTDTTSYWNNLPKPHGWVNDFEDVFTDSEEKFLDSLISAYEKKTTREFAIVTIPQSATGIDRFDELVIYIANKWGIGKIHANNGVTIGFSKGYKKIWISLGLGTEKILSDAHTKKIIEEAFIPSFKKEKYFEGTFEGMSKIMDKLDRTTWPFINLSEMDVFQYLKLLKIEPWEKDSNYILTIDMDAPKNWVTGKEIDSLMSMINSQVPARCVMQVISSYIPSDKTATIGGHAMDIIEAYKDNKSYPVYLTYCDMTDQDRIKKLQQWWSEQNK